MVVTSGGGSLNLPTPGTIAKQLIGYLNFKQYVDNTEYWTPPDEEAKKNQRKAVTSNVLWMVGHTAVNTLVLGYASRKLLGKCCLTALGYGFGGAMALNGVMYALAVREGKESHVKAT